MTKIVYVDAFSGISGDMLLGAFLDAGLPIEVLEDTFSKLGLEEAYQLSFQKVMKGAIQAGSCKIILDQAEDHEHNEAHEGHHHHEEHGEHHHHHDGDEEHDHHHHNEEHHEHKHHHHNRTFADIRQILTDAQLPVNVLDKSLKMFSILANAEGKVHGVDPDQVHFHEVGATDSILDIVGISVALNYFQIDDVYSSSLPWSEGTVHTQHGDMPIPAPATLELLQNCQANMRPFPAKMELITPTGAAFLAAFAKFQQPEMTITGQGSGAGSKHTPWPNILRIILGESDQDNQSQIVVIETHIDDMNPQWYGNLMERCFAAGALDVAYEPIYMKKNRPATKVSIVANQLQEEDIANILLKETSTFGVRVYPVKRYEAKRDWITVQTEWGEVRVKQKWHDGKIIQSVPEYDDCYKIAESTKLPFPEVYRKVLNLIA